MHLNKSVSQLFTSGTDDDQKGDSNPQLPVGHKTEGSLNERVAHTTENNAPLQQKANKTGWIETPFCPVLSLTVSSIVYSQIIRPELNTKYVIHYYLNSLLIHGISTQTQSNTNLLSNQFNPIYTKVGLQTVFIH